MALTVGLVFGGCGPAVVDPDVGGSGATDSADASTVAQTEGTGTEPTDPSRDTEADGDGRGDGGESDGDTVDACVLPHNDPSPTHSAAIMIRNDSDAPRFVVSYSPFECSNTMLEILIEDKSILWDSPMAVPFPCDACNLLCDLEGGVPGLVINPGATAEIPWSGGYWTETPLSEACARVACDADPRWGNDPILPTSCDVLRYVGRVDYVARVHVYDDCPGYTDNCTCEGDVCEFNTERGWGNYTVKASGVFPDGTTIVLE
jgi:hypothetical protein